MGAEPAWFTLNLSLPEFDENSRQWLESFSQSLFTLAKVHNIQLVGGDTTRGSLSISIQVAGYIKPGHALSARRVSLICSKKKTVSCG